MGCITLHPRPLLQQNPLHPHSIPTSSSVSTSSDDHADDGKTAAATTATTTNPLPTLLHTPSGLAILEVQGTFNLPSPPSSSSSPSLSSSDPIKQATKATEVGRLVFPLYDYCNPTNNDDGKWMKRVYLYIGKHQRMTGEVKKLGKPLAVIRKREGTQNKVTQNTGEEEGTEELEIVEIVRCKILFANRPEPVGEE
ncbi:hypothetical protein AAFC00_002066 [Neodothiora populina]|uniref:Chromosome transmission fidelity protein 8 n=1 Tax=Neodothiora populina TaxID=2781224 RepID=A0ABR3PG53_9PEZI